MPGSGVDFIRSRQLPLHHRQLAAWSKADYLSPSQLCVHHSMNQTRLNHVFSSLGAGGILGAMKSNTSGPDIDSPEMAAQRDFNQALRALASANSGIASPAGTMG